MNGGEAVFDWRFAIEGGEAATAFSLPGSQRGEAKAIPDASFGIPKP
jgi:hypothetical protein